MRNHDHYTHGHPNAAFKSTKTTTFLQFARLNRTPNGARAGALLCTMSKMHVLTNRIESSCSEREVIVLKKSAEDTLVSKWLC